MPLTIPHRVFKSSAKDSTNNSMGIKLQGSPRGSFTVGTTPTTRALEEHRPLLRVDNQAVGAHIASSLNFDLEAFCHNPMHGSFVPLAFQPSAIINCVNQQFLSY
ncbi:uncharacterized protein LOC111310690 [Durio zibethinus]|uniref:Uncharacterized protein LOC111310690 n=1 Tax=Durio zibethinus TaxID=66656 RepID=A0A6P6ALY1_DURZI|nr:uncharacterized protein LOC111310690 [Durio zibethinus]